MFDLYTLFNVYVLCLLLSIFISKLNHFQNYPYTNDLMGNIVKSRKETRPEQTEFKNMEPHTIDKSVNFNTATGKVIHLKKDLKPEAFENKTTIPLKSLIADFIKEA